MPYPITTYITLDLETLAQRFDTAQLLLKSRLYWLEHYERCVSEPEFLKEQLQKVQTDVEDLRQELLNISQAIGILKYNEENQEDDEDD